MDPQLEAFLQLEEEATARLMAYYRNARLELTDRLDRGLVSAVGPSGITEAEASFYSALLTDVDQIGEQLAAGGGAWVNDSIPSSFVEGARAIAGEVTFSGVDDLAVRTLSASSLDLIQSTSLGIRRAVQEQIAAAVVQKLSPAELRARIVATGLQAGRWADVETRAGVIARTEIMRAYNSGALTGIDYLGIGAVVWLASPDERACWLCAPRHGRVYSRVDWPGAPAHPRCRCTMRAARPGERPGDVVESWEGSMFDEGPPVARATYQSWSEFSPELRAFYRAQSPYSDLGDRQLGAIVGEQGFNGLPHVVDDLQPYVDRGETVFYRGLSARTPAQRDEYVGQLLGGPTPYQGTGIWGNGTYVATGNVTIKRSVLNSSGFATGETALWDTGASARLGSETFAYGDGIVLRGTIRADARIIDYPDLQVAWDSYQSSETFYTTAEHLRDIGHFAAASGYDAIRVPAGYSRGGAITAKVVDAGGTLPSGWTASGFDDVGEQYVILNRTAIRLERPIQP